MNRIFYGILLSVFVVSNGYSGIQLPLTPDLLESWGGGTWNTCAGHSIPSDACIGTTNNDCHKIPSMDTSNSKDCKFTAMNSFVYARNYTDEAAIRMLIATKINEYGAYFCPIQIESKNKNRNNSWTEYAYATSTDKCTWLCKNGYGGVDCKSKTTTTCDPNIIRRDVFSNIPRVASGANIEDSIAMLRANHSDNCGLNSSQEYDIVLAVTGWLESGHGAWVQPLHVGAQRSCWKGMISWPALIPMKFPKQDRILVCKDGYKHNAAGNDCVAINTEACFDTKCKSPKDCLCSGWDKYKEAEHTYKRVGDCYQYRCKAEGKAFEDEFSHKCVDCKIDARTGVVDGVCIKCEKGKMFDPEQSKSNYCVETRKLSKSDLKYGFQVSKSNVKKADANNYGACWEVVEPSAYSDCVLNSGKITQEAPVENVGSVKEETFENEMISQLENKTFENVGSVKEKEMISPLENKTFENVGSVKETEMINQLLKNKTFKKEMISPLENKTFETKMMSQDVK